MKPAGKSPRAKKNRRTIGLLIGRLGDIGYAANVWPGVADVAAERDANLICFVGGALNALHEFDLQRNVIYDLASPENVDGLVAMSGSIGQFVGPERVLRYYDRFRPLPMISVAMALDGFPAVLVDNATGVRQAITHLIEVHGFRRIAFIRGPSTNTEAEERFQTYREVLDAHRLPFNAELVTDGNYLAVAGAAAVHRLLDERKVSFEAIASANDEMAIGAMGALRERGTRVPEDICVTGFDNVEEARYAAPPLTTVRQPLYEQGRKAAEMLLDLLAGKDIPQSVILPTELVIRQSCGCLPRANGFITDTDEAPAANAPKLTPAARRKKILEAMTAAAGVSTPGLEPGWQERLLDSLSSTAAEKNPHGVFLHAWDDTLRRIGAQGGDVAQWHEVLAVLRRQALPASPAANREDLDPFWRQAEGLIVDIAQWSQVYRRLQANRRAFDFMTSISEPLMTAFDIAGLADVVADQLPRMGVRACYLSLYEKPEGTGGAAPTAWSRLILAYNESGRVKLPSEGIRFPSRQLVPREIFSSDKRYARMLEPLHFRDETQLGFLLFEPLQTEVGAHREALSRQISTALKGAILLQERQQAEQSLRASEQEERRFQERLRTLLEISNELSRAESVDALCRRAVELGLSKLGFDRMGIWFHLPEQAVIQGSFGTDSQGRVIDERGLRVKAEYSPNDVLRQTHPVTLLHTGVTLRNGEGKTVGNGMRAEAAMWDGEKTIGLVSIDNLLHGRLITEHDGEILNSFASSLGYLCSRKRAEETLRAGEQKEREFQERLRTLLEISNELSRAESLDALCRQAVELGRTRLGFDRLSIWFYNPDPGIITGSFGTGPDGEIVDERGIHLDTTGQHMEILRQTRPIALVTADTDLRDMHANIIGRGSRVHAAMWNGEKVIGFVSMDNLLCHRAVTDNDAQLLNSFACTLGYLCSRKRIEEQLRESEQSERQFEERLRTLLEISNELSRAESVDAMCRQAVELGRARLGFDRLGIWFRSPEPGFVTGSWGTDENGGLRDERNTRHIAGSGANEPLNQKHPTVFLQKDINLLDDKSKVIGRGMHAQAAMWDGEQTIGLIVMDNLLRGRPITEQDCELLNLYASTLGNLVSRKRTDEQLRESEQSERRFEERLRVLMEISNELSRAESVDALCRQAVELGRNTLDFDRLAIWFYSPDPGIISGSFGTGPDGAITDERAITLNTADLDMEILEQTRPIALVKAGSDLHDMHRTVVGRGSLVHAAMWNGEKVIGFIAMDNLLRHRPVTEQDCELLNLFASSLGYLCSRQRVEETLRESEQKEREFQERLRILLEISNELSLAESVDDLCRQAVELGRARLDFDRLGIWFHRPEAGIIDGSFGTDAAGNTTDERAVHLATRELQLEILRQTRPIALIWPNAVLRDGHAVEIGRGDQAQAAMWNGEKVIGFISMDNLLRRRPITEQDCDILNLFASTLGYLSSRKQAEEELREYSENLEEKVDERTRALRQAQDDLVRQEKLAVLGQLTATVSHELRNPLATIRVSATAVDLKTRDRGLGVERALDRIQRNITRCDTIISELLDYTRMPDLDRQTIDFDEWLNRLLDEQMIPEGITLRRDLASRARIRLDGERFQRVVINLLDNARQAIQTMTQEDGGAKELAVESRQEAGRLVLSIRDTGGGIPPEVLPRIFEPLFSTKGFGVGLGLSIVKGIVEQHGGTIEITSEPGRGTTAVVRLPLSEPPG
jgi:DNA-binding LacI/PurR family transcriptional regulator/signal transduction histidine kinase